MAKKTPFFETKHNQPQKTWFYDVLFMAWLFTICVFPDFYCCAIHIFTFQNPSLVTTMVTCSLRHPGFVRSIVACCRMAAESPNLAQHGSWTPCCFLFFFRWLGDSWKPQFKLGNDINYMAISSCNASCKLHESCIIRFANVSSTPGLLRLWRACSPPSLLLSTKFAYRM